MRARRLLSAGLSATLLLLVSVVPAHADTTGLPADPRSSGYVGLCDENDVNVTGGDVDTVPFVWKAVSSVAPPRQYQGAGQNAVLDIYQPRPGTEPGDWSGQALTSAGYYTNAARPSVQATYADESLADFISQFPPEVNGLYVLRMAFGKQNYGLYSATYPTAVIQVVGKSWHLVSGGTVDCPASSAKSNEQLTGVVAASQTLPHPASVASGAGSAAPSASTTSVAAGSYGPISQSPRDLGATQSGNTLLSSPGGLALLVVPLVVLVLLVVFVLVRRRRHRPRHELDPAT